MDWVEGAGDICVVVSRVCCTVPPMAGVLTLTELRSNGRISVFVMISPVGVLLAVLITVSLRARANEFTALFSGGISLLRASAPLLVGCAAVSLLALGASEILVPRANRGAREIARVRMRPEKVADPERKRRFVQEAKAASALSHPNIIHVYDIGQTDGIDYIAMEYVAGKRLDRLIPRHGMPLTEVLKCAVQIADALEAAHGAGIVHRDLKPGNVMVNEAGQVKVLDFGLAKQTEMTESSEASETRTMAPLTEEGTILGTIAYMSPEQAEGKPLDFRSDIFSFGTLLYEMVTGRRAFEADSTAARLAALLHENPILPS